MPPLPRFAVPAGQVDLSGTQQATLEQQWSGNVNRWTESGILGDPWTSLNDSNRKYYYNPLKTNVAGGTSAPIDWSAYPNRILLAFPGATFLEQMGLAEGVHEDGTFGPPSATYRPRGPRGWQDEYCEWISIRDSSGNITRIDFTCENPEYFFSLWRVDPQRVLEIYRQLVDPAVQLADLFLLDSAGNPVIDRATGAPAYDPSNKWNNQPSAGGVTGAVHLISPPNTLGAEIYLAAAATILRQQNGQPVSDPATLIACSQYGTAGRNSDPNIGASVNGIIAGGGVVASLEDPVGLYIQTPDFSGYLLPPDPNLPGDADPSECWQVLRGRSKGAGDNVDFILHARFAIPTRWKDAGVTFTVSDIQILGNPIKYGAQITQTFQIALRGLALPTTLPAQPRQKCRAANPQVIPVAQAVQDMNLFEAGTTSTAVTLIEQGTSVPNIALWTANARKNTRITFTGPAGVKVNVTAFQDLGANGQLFTLTITADKAAPLGDRSLQLRNASGPTGPAAPGMLSVVPPGTLGKQALPAPPAAMAVQPLAATLPIAAADVQEPASPSAAAARAVEMAMERRVHAQRN